MVWTAPESASQTLSLAVRTVRFSLSSSLSESDCRFTKRFATGFATALVGFSSSLSEPLLEEVSSSSSPQKRPRSPAAPAPVALLIAAWRATGWGKGAGVVCAMCAAPRESVTDVEDGVLVDIVAPVLGEGETRKPLW